VTSARTTQELCADVEGLVGAWCDRRCLKALRAVLHGWPLSSGLTDDWGGLLDALEKVRAFAGSELTQPERTLVEDLIREIGLVLRARLERA
jgi:hypothetical protein